MISIITFMHTIILFYLLLNFKKNYHIKKIKIYS